MKKEYHVGVASTGMVLPKQCYTNQDIVDEIKRNTAGCDYARELSAEWIEKNIWIKTRYHFGDDERFEDVCHDAVKRALDNAGWGPEDLDFVIVSSISFHNEFDSLVIPSVACLVQEKLKAYNAFAYDTSAACSGWVYAMGQGIAFIESGMSAKGVVVCAEKQRIGLDFSNHQSSVLIGDVATATLLESVEQPKVGAVHLQANDERHLSDIIKLPFRGDDPAHPSNPGYFVLKGKTVFKQGITTMIQLTQKALIDNNLQVDDVDWFIYHQANGAMLRMVGRKVGMKDERNLMNIQKLGNTTAGTIPSVLHMHIEDGTIKRGDTVCCIAFGGGLTAGSLVFQY